MDANLQAWLDTIAACEGTGNCYNALFGYTPSNGRIFDNDYATHPNIKIPFTDQNGHVDASSAAGRYQIIFPTFKLLAARLGLADFSPPTQDAMAVELCREAGALDAIEAGDLSAAIEACGGIWASLPSSHYPQPRRTFAFVASAFVGAGGALA